MIRDETLLPHSHPWYRKPTGDEVREVLRALDWTQAHAARMLGVRSGRTVRRWTAGERNIPYAAWRLMLFAAERANAEDDLKWAKRKVDGRNHSTRRT